MKRSMIYNHSYMDGSVAYTTKREVVEGEGRVDSIHAAPNAAYVEIRYKMYAGESWRVDRIPWSQVLIITSEE